MPSTITHTYFIGDVYQKLPIKTKELLVGEKDFLKITAQNMDVLYFYKILEFNKGKEIQEFGTYFHNHKTYLFFETLINCIKYNNYQNSPDVIAFLYGMISHYILDSNTHPYTIYKTGFFKKDDPTTYKYNQVHGTMESWVDNYFIHQREQIEPRKLKCHNFCFNLKPFSKELTEVINFTYKEVFNIDNFSEIYYQSIKDMKTFYRIFRYDPYGLKKKFYFIVDLFSPKYYRKKVSLSYYMKIHDSKMEEFLNLEHNTWHNPTNKKMKSNESFLDLYLKSLYETNEVINRINDYIYNNKKTNLKEIIKNNSYLTGRDCNKEYELKHFEF